MQVAKSLFTFVLIFSGLTEARALEIEKAIPVDLTHTFDNETIYWPTMPSGFEKKEIHKGITPGGFFFSAYSFSAPEHGGTHLDAPFHFSEKGLTADQIPLQKLIGNGIVIDITEHAKQDADYRLTIQDIQNWEKTNGPIPNQSIVLLRTGWSTKWPNKKLYLGDDTPGRDSNLHFPSYGKEAAAYLVAKKVKALGIDTASLDYGASKEFEVHQILGPAGVIGLENLTQLEKLPATGSWIVALPMKIGGGSGAPLRIIAFIEAASGK